MINVIKFLFVIMPIVSGYIPHIGDDYKRSVYFTHNESLVVFFVFLSLGLGSLFKEINKNFKVLAH